MTTVTSPDIFFESLDKWQTEAAILREIILKTGLSETIKWGSPCYTYNNENVVGLATFKSYVGIWFFQGALLKDENKYLINAQENKTKIMLQWRFQSLDEIQNAPIEAYIYESIENFRQGKKLKPSPATKTFDMPELLLTSLNQNQDLKEQWEKLTNGCKREYAQYITEAKREETKIRRMEKITPMILKGKGINDKYK